MVAHSGQAYHLNSDWLVLLGELDKIISLRDKQKYETLWNVIKRLSRFFQTRASCYIRKFSMSVKMLLPLPQAICSKGIIKAHTPQLSLSQGKTKNQSVIPWSTSQTPHCLIVPRKKCIWIVCYCLSWCNCKNYLFHAISS